MLRSKRNNLTSFLPLLALLIFGFFYRFYGLLANYSFWTDEEHVAIFSRAILEKGTAILDNGYSTGAYQWLQYWLSAISAKIFGLNEFAIRFPSVIFGILTIWAVYLLGKELFDRKIGFLSAFLIAFLRIEILWSRQARPYQALQFFFVLGVWFICRMTKKEKIDWHYLPGFLICGVLASLMHGLGLVLFFGGFLYILLFEIFGLKRKIKTKWKIPLSFLWLGLFLIVFLLFVYLLRSMIIPVISRLGEVKNLFYYRVFLSHNYLLLSFFALLGILFAILQKNKRWLILFLFLFIQTLIVSFFLPQPFTRYFYIVFPFLVLLSAAGLFEFSCRVTKSLRIRYLMVLVITFLVLVISNKFILVPQRVYSLNQDMQEIPEVDWKKIYGFTQNKLAEDQEIVLLTNWTDLPVWFLGEGELSYLLRKNSSFMIDSFTNAKIIPDLAGFVRTVQEEEKGLMIIDSWDDYVPDGIRDYAMENLKKEIEVDRLYSVQPRLWPVEIYSWGI